MSIVHAVYLLTDESIHALAFDTNGRRKELIEKTQQLYTLPDSLLENFDADELSENIAQTLESLQQHPIDSVDLIIPLQWCFTHLLKNSQKQRHRTHLRTSYINQKSNNNHSLYDGSTCWAGFTPSCPAHPYTR